MIKRVLFISMLWVFLVSLFSYSVNASNIGLISNSTWEQNLTAVYYSSLAWGDIDNDGDLDLVLVGQSNSGDVAKIYINNGTTLNENQTWQQNLTTMRDGSIALGDIDNDGDLDLVLTGCNSGGGQESCTSNVIKIYINNNTSLVENSTWEGNLTSIGDGSIALGDIDNDGDLDLGLVGISSNGNVAKIYINNNTSLIENTTWQQGIDALYQGSLAWGDIDNDGDLDLVLTGDVDVEGKITKVYINNGTSLVENSIWEQDLLGVDRSSVILGDIDNDGDLDLALIGQAAGDHLHFYLNNGTSLVVHQTQQQGGLEGYFRGSIGWGDYDNDGDLDIVATGKEYDRNWVYNNNETNFEVDYTAGNDIYINNMQQGALAWSDIDNDGDLDLIASGVNKTGLLTKVYINNNTNSNAAPIPPIGAGNFTASYENGKLTLIWGNGSDTETNISGLYYNLRVGACSGCHNIVSGIYGGSSGGGGGGGPASGYFGNMMQRKSITLNFPNLQPNQTIYWSVQTIDTGLAKSSWSTEQNYTTPMDVSKPTIILNSPVNNYNTTNPTIIFNTTVYDNDNLTNVTLWGSWSGWHANETNSSGFNNTDYIFTKNLTEYSDGDYTWQIKAYDNSTNYALSPIRTFTIDTTPPFIDLISPGGGSTWSSSSTVTFTYNVSDVRINNCSLIINGAIDQTNPSITVNTQQTFTKSLNNGIYSWSINCTDTVGYANSSSTRQLTVSYNPPSGNGGGGSSGGISEPSTKTKSQIWTEMTPGITEVMEIIPEIGLTQINITVKNQANNVKITVTRLEDKPASIVQEIIGRIYKYIEIEARNLEDENIDKVKIQFPVNKTWFIRNNVDRAAITLNRYHNNIWKKLQTREINEDNDYIYYESETPGFTTFAITGEEITTTTITTTTIPETTTTMPVTREEIKIDYTLFILVIIVLIMGIIAWRFQTIKRLIGRR